MLLLLLCYFLLRTSIVQTWITQNLASYFSNKLHTQIRIEGVDIEFFDKIVLENLYIEDQKKDTLLFAQKIKIGIEHFDFKKHLFIANNIILEYATAKIIRYAEEKDYNFQFIVDEFSSPKTTDTSATDWQLEFKKITLSNIDFLYKDGHDTSIVNYGINYSDIRSKNTSGIFENIQIANDTIRTSIKNLSAQEKSGFHLKEFSCAANICPTTTSLKNLKIKTPFSNVLGDIVFTHQSYDDYDDFITRVFIKSEFDNTRLNLSDIAYFAPELEGISKEIIFTGKISGLINNLKGRNIKAIIGKDSKLLADITLTGLPNIEDAYINMNVKELITNKKDLDEIPLPPFNKKEYLEVPKNFALLGKIKFTGKYTGYFNDFVAYGKLNTALGSITSDLSMKKEVNKKVIYKGKIKSEGFKIGLFLDQKDLGLISINADVEGEGLKRDEIKAKLNGKINTLEYNQYSYKDIDIEGALSKKVFSGYFKIKDENIIMDFDGNIDLSQKKPILKFDSDISLANLTALNFSSHDQNKIISGKMHINVIGDNIDNSIGNINIDNLFYKENNKQITLKKLNVSMDQLQHQRSISIQSDALDGTIKGKFKIAELQNSIEELLTQYLPALSENRRKKLLRTSEQNINFDILFKNTNELTNVFLPRIKIANGSGIDGSYSSINKDIRVNAKSDLIDVDGMKIKDWSLSFSNNEKKLTLNTGCKTLQLDDSLYINNVLITGNTNTQNNVYLKTEWNDDNEVSHKSAVIIESQINNARNYRIKFLPSTVFFADSAWHIEQNNSLIVDNKTLLINNIKISNAKQYVVFDGIISENSNDKLLLSINGFSLKTINPLLKRYSVALKGNVDGNASIANIYEKSIITSDLEITQLYVNNELVGSGGIKATWNNEIKSMLLNGSFARDIIPNIEFSGSYSPFKENDNLDFSLNMKALKMQVFENYIKDYCADFKGEIYGTASIKGSLKKPLINGILNVNATKVRVNYLNTIYHLNSKIIIEPEDFSFEDVKLYDENNNLATVNGKVYHNNFKNFQLDIDITTDKFLFLNTNESLNSLYYGVANASGTVNFFGLVDNITIDAVVKTAKGTQINIPLSTTEEVGENNFIKFVSKKDTGKFQTNYKVDLNGLQLNFDLDVTPDAEIQLIFDSKIGDVIKGRGSGNLKMNINTLGNFKMFGEYFITEGDYLFTLKNIINKRFDIEKGSSIKWAGDPYGADVNITAIYRQRTSLQPFFPTDSSGIYKKRYPVNSKLIMTNGLMSPDIHFDIEIPTVDEATRQTIKSYLSTEQEMNRQVFSLLILKSFVTPPQLLSSGAGEQSGGSNAGAANSSELLSSQLSNWLSQISKDVDIGVNYRPGDKISNEELELVLSTQLLNDRISIDGSVSNNGNQQQNTSNIVGDVNVEYKVTEDGKVRVKAFNKANDNPLLYNSSAPYTQGVGLSYREEFNTVNELYRRYLYKLKKKKEKD